jgi:predicted permease
LNIGEGAERIGIEVVTDNYFSMLGVRPAAGRVIHPNEGRAPGDAPVIVLAYEYWTSRFNRDASVIGRTVRLNGRPYTVIGVVSERFTDTEALVRIDAYVPAWQIDDFNEARSGSSVLDDRGFRQFTVLGRLQPGVSIEQARTALNVRAAALAREYPRSHADASVLVVPETHARPNPEIGPFLRVASTAMAGLAAVLLLITTASVANLLMARAVGRVREVALRAALGARRGRIVRQLVTEAVVLALLAAIIAIPVAVLGTNQLHDLIARASAIATFDADFSIDYRVLAITVMMALVAGVLSGLVPALAACRADLVSSLKRSTAGAADSRRGHTHPTLSRGGFRSALVVAQIALSLALLVSGGLFVRSLARARDVDLGFRPDGVLLASTSPSLAGLDFPRRIGFYRSVRDRIMRLPGVEDAAWISFPPLGIIGEVATVSPGDARPDPAWRPPAVTLADVSGNYFATVRIDFLSGRTFDDRDSSGGNPVVIVNHALANQFWPNRDAVGQRLTLRDATWEVVGVVRTGKYQNVWESPRGAVFRPLTQATASRATMVVRTSNGTADLAQAVQREVRAVNPDVPIYDVRSMADHLDNGSAFFPFRVGALIASLFGSIGVLLASIGLYGMTAYHVSGRRQEFGIRMALGARAGDIMGDVLSGGGRLALVGVAIGIVLAAGLATLMRGVLVGVSPFDPFTYATVAGLLVGICLVASLVPAWRATAVDPLVALRAE